MISMDMFGLWQMPRKELAELAMKEFNAIRKRYQLSPEGDLTYTVLSIFKEEANELHR